MALRSKLTVGLIQQKAYEDKGTCLQNTVKAVREAAKQGARLVLLQELHLGFYFCQREDYKHFEMAEEIPGPSSSQLASLAKELNIVLVGSLFERRAPGIYHNTAVVFEKDGHIAGKYRKMHIPDDPAYYEKFYFTPGDLGFTPIETSVARLGVLVCWDQWYPEAARLMALAGADMLLYPTAIGWDPTDVDAEKTRQRDAWVTSQRAHAVANGLPVLVANRVGFEANPSGHGAGLQFWGHSFVAGPQGEFIAVAGSSEAEILLADVDLQRSEHVRRIWPFLRDRRIDAYVYLLLRYRD